MDQKAILKAFRRVLHLTGKGDWAEHRYNLWIRRKGLCPWCSGEGVYYGGGPNLKERLRVPDKDMKGVKDEIWYAYQCNFCNGTGIRPNRLERKRKG